MPEYTFKGFIIYRHYEKPLWRIRHPLRNKEDLDPGGDTIRDCQELIKAWYDELCKQDYEQTKFFGE